MSGKAHLDVEAAVRPGPRAERGAVGAGDGPDDGETKPVTVSVADPLAAKLLEWLEQPAQLVGRDQYAGVVHRDHRPPGAPRRRDLPATTGLRSLPIGPWAGLGV